MVLDIVLLEHLMDHICWNIYLTILSLLSWFTAYYLYKKGYKIKS